MSRRNGNRSRFHVDRKRKLKHRQRLRELVGGPKSAQPAAAAAPTRAEPRK